MAENTLPAPAGAILPAATVNPFARFAGPIAQVKGVLAQPAVKKSLPLVATVMLIALAAIAWTMLSTPPQRQLYAGLGDADKAAISDALDKAGIKSRYDNAGTITVGEDDYYKARMLLASQNLPKADPGGYAILDQLPLGVSRAVEGERLRQARESELARSIGEIDSVADARVHLAMPEQSVFLRDNADPSASVVVRLNAGRSLTQDQVRSIVNLVASSVPGMKPDSVTVVDQAGELLTKPGGAGADSASDKRIEFQRKVEDKYRQQLAQLLTPLVGSGNFSAEVQADIDLDETQATRESYDKDGSLRAEQGSWTGVTDNQPAVGIPGALSNTAPPPTTANPVTPPPAAQPNGQPVPGQPPADAAQSAAATNVAKQSDSFNRNFELGKQVSVTRAAPGTVKRLSVAVVLRETPGATKRTPAEIQQITNLVRAATGFTQERGDIVTVISRPFDGASAEENRPWYEAGWLPMVARNATAIIIALLVLLIGVRPIVSAILPKREKAAKMKKGKKGAKAEELTAEAAAADAALIEAGAVPTFLKAPSAEGTAAVDEDGEPIPGARQTSVSLEMLDSARSYDDKVALVRQFTREDPTRAALAIKEMIRS